MKRKVSVDQRKKLLNKAYLIGWEPNISPQRSNAKIALSACTIFKYEFDGKHCPTERESFNKITVQTHFQHVLSPFLHL